MMLSIVVLTLAGVVSALLAYSLGEWRKERDRNKAVDTEAEFSKRKAKYERAERIAALEFELLGIGDGKPEDRTDEWTTIASYRRFR